MPSAVADRPHRVVSALLAQDGTRNAAAICTDLMRSFPNVRCLLMCGIAGGFPAPHDPERHIGLGDVVTSAGGVVDYDHVRTVNGRDRIRRSTEGLSKTLLRADRELETRALAGDESWTGALREWEARASGEFRRPNARPGVPRVHRAAIGSADRLLRDATKRDRLARQHGIRAVEMEGSGIAVGADLHGAHWYMVRGIADHCDGNKDDTWHGYASLAAAAYTSALLAEVVPFGTQGASPSPNGGSVGGLGAVVEALLSLAVMEDDHQRRAVVAELPRPIRTSVPAHQVARLHVIAIVRTCERFDNGREALIDALRVTVGDIPELDLVISVIRSHWSGP
ncbi:effector-associated domain 2-containing protein [Virgisporangium aliadipatigenens]|nr:hypothetical protein [Virgisporangium aliadipatigenens]